MIGMHELTTSASEWKTKSCKNPDKSHSRTIIYISIEYGVFKPDDDESNGIASRFNQEP